MEQPKVIPPTLTLLADTLYAIQGTTALALSPEDGTVHRTYRLGSSSALIGKEQLLAIRRNPDGAYGVEAQRVKDGAYLWYVPLADSPLSPPAEADSLILVCGERAVYALERNSGSLLWKRDIAGSAPVCPLIHHDIAFVAQPRASRLQALHIQDGSLLWQTEVPHMALAPCFTNGDHLIVRERRGYTVLRADDGTPMGRRELAGGMLPVGFAVFGDALYMSARQTAHTLHLGTGSDALTTQIQQRAILAAWQISTGVLLWERELTTQTAVPGVPGAASEMVAAGVDNGLLHTLATGGQPLWHRMVGAGLALGCPLLTPGTLYVGASDGYVYAFASRDGTARWRALVGTTAQLSTGGTLLPLGMER